jgi:holo-[acyl-carrier protein] synthase
LIAGVGIDIVNLHRIARVREKYRERFINKILGAIETSEYYSLLEKKNGQKLADLFLARRFAAKEAVSKAIGYGLRHPISLKSIEIRNNSLGKPFVVFSQLIWEELRLTTENIHISITDDSGFAQAMAILER